MQIPASKLLEFLVEKEITHLYHANTVTTACCFLRRGQLLARGVVDYLRDNQTAQDSDENDKLRGVYFDIFMDTVDIHDRARAANVYGPVLFKLSVKKLLGQLQTVWITRSNPMKWTGSTPHTKRWFGSLKEYKAEFSYGEFGHMVVLRHVGGILPLASCLSEIIIDDPQTTHKDLDVYALARGALMLAVTESADEQEVRFKKRKCSYGCRCTGSYQTDPGKLAKLFLPQRACTSH